MLASALRAGVAGFVLKGGSAEDLQRAVRWSPRAVRGSTRGHLPGARGLPAAPPTRPRDPGVDE